MIGPFFFFLALLQHRPVGERHGGDRSGAPSLSSGRPDEGRLQLLWKQSLPAVWSHLGGCGGPEAGQEATLQL